MRKFEMSTWLFNQSRNSISLSLICSFVPNQAYMVKPFSLKTRLSMSSQMLKRRDSPSGVRKSQIGVMIVGDWHRIMGRQSINFSESTFGRFGGMMNFASSKISSS